MTHLSGLRRFAWTISLTTLLGVSAAFAAPLGLTPGYPDLASGGSINYSHDGTSGLFEVDDTGIFTMIWDGGNQSDFINGTYDLDATFDSAGNFTGGTISVTGTSLTANPLWAGTNIVSGDLTDFGFAGTDGAGTFEFVMSNLTGDMADNFGGFHGGGIIISTFDLAGAGISGEWDPGNDGEPGFFLDDFSGTASTVDTFVPVPAAVWLFGSSLLGLFAARRRRV